MSAPLFDMALGRLRRLPFFSELEYLDLNPDVAQAGIEGGVHALINGCAEGRRLTTPARLAGAWGDAAARSATVPTSPVNDAAPRELTGPVSLFVSSRSEPGTKFLAACLARDLESAGAVPTLRTELDPCTAETGAAIVVAPHEFFRRGVGPSWCRTDLVRSGLMVNTAPPTLPQLGSALPFLLACRGVLDLCPQMTALLAEAGVPTRQIRPTVPPRAQWLNDTDDRHPLARALPADVRRVVPVPGRECPIDFAFLGRATPRRTKVLGRMSAETAHLRSFVHLRGAALHEDDEIVGDRALFRIAGHVAARSRVMLQLAADEMPVVDWLAVYQAMAAGAAVVTDTWLPHREFAPEIHLFQTDTRHVGDLVRWLIEDGEGQRAAADARTAAQAILADKAAAAGWTAGITAWLGQA